GFDSRNAPTAGGDGGLAQGLELAPVEKGFHDVLLDLLVAFIDLVHGHPQGRQVFDAFVDAQFLGVIASLFGAEEQVITHVLLDGLVLVVAADDRVAQVVVGDLSLEAVAGAFVDASAIDDGEFIRSADVAIEVQETVAELIQRGAAVKDNIGAEFGLGKEQTIIAGSTLAVGLDQGRSQLTEPPLGASNDRLGRKAIGQLLQTGWITAAQKGIAVLAETDVFAAHLTSQPIVAVDDHAAVERQIGTQAQEHRPEVGIQEIEVVLIDEPLAEFQVVTAALGRIADGDAGPLSALEDDSNAGLAMQPSVKRFDPFVPANILGGSHHRNALLGGHGLNQGMVLFGNGLQVSPGNRLHTTTFL